MRAVVHFGMPKAGSSALQDALDAARPELRAAGILYPRPPVIGHNANFVMVGLVAPERRPRFVRHALKGKGDPEALFADWRRELQDTLRQGGADTLLLSAENLWEIVSAEPAGRLRAFLHDLGATRIEAVAYVRRPSDWYLSAAQQVLRASHKLRPPGPVAYRAPIETFAAHVADPGALRVFPFDRATFPEGDILNHFREAVLPKAPLAPAAAGRTVNETLSAEGMTLLRAYRAEVYPKRNNVFTRPTRQVRSAIQSAEAEAGGSDRPRLHPDLADRLDHGSPDLAWLARAHDVIFPGIDYDRVAPADWPAAPQRIEEICPVDPDRLVRLTSLTLHALARRAAGGGTGGGGGGGDGT